MPRQDDEEEDLPVIDAGHGRLSGRRIPEPGLGEWPGDDELVSRNWNGTEVFLSRRDLADFRLAREGASPVTIPGDIRWILPGECIEINGRILSDGMIYVGSDLPSSPEGWSSSIPDPCLINPSLPVEGQSSSAMPPIEWKASYSGLAPEPRGRYLDWLAGGRVQPGIPNGYIGMFLAGVERRLLVDDPERDERDHLLAELDRLAHTYGLDEVVTWAVKKVRRFIHWRDILVHPDWEAQWVPDPMPQFSDDEAMLRIAAGSRIAAGKGLPFNLAIATFLAIPATSGGMTQLIAATRTRAAFLALVRLRFEAKWPGGYTVRDRQGHSLSIRYYGINHYLPVRPIEPPIRMPDPFDLSWTRLADLCGKAMAELSTHARLVKPNLSGEKSAEALAALPGDLYRQRFGRVAEMADWLETLPSTVRMPIHELWSRCDATGTQPSSKKLLAVGAVLERLGYCMEPDRGAGWAPDPDDKAIQVYRATDIKVPLRLYEPPYLAARFACHALIAIAAAVGRAAFRPINRVGSWSALERRDTLRLEAHMAGWDTAVVKKTALIKLADGIDAASKPKIAAFLRQASRAEGLVGTPALAVLQSMFRLLGEDNAPIYAAFFPGGQGAPARVLPSVCGTDGLAPHARPDPAILDLAQIVRIRAETRKVSDMLSAVFAGDDISSRTDPASDQPPTAGASLTVPALAGLDARHVALVSSLYARELWSRADFALLAQSAGLMPDGAMETVNEWAFDRFDDALIEDGDTLVINLKLLPIAKPI